MLDVKRYRVTSRFYSTDDTSHRLIRHIAESRQSLPVTKVPSMAGSVVLKWVHVINRGSKQKKEQKIFDFLSFFISDGVICEVKENCEDSI